MTRSWVAWGSAGAFIALATAVHLGLLDRFDLIARAWARPDNVWGAAQLRADIVVEGLRPPIVAVLLMAFTAVCCVRRRSLRPAAFVGVVSVMTIALTVVTKIAVGRPDPHGLVGSTGGSYPSGHVITLIVSLGLVVLVAWPRARRRVWLVPALAGGLMGICLLLQAAHWFTDIVGGILLAVVVLSVATASCWTRWLPDRPRNENKSATSDVRRSSSLTSVSAAQRQHRAIAQLATSAVPDCYDPGRGICFPDPIGGT
jgi:membrane-associated phospholipid phosphatase